MSNSPLPALAYLLQSGYTHNDLKNLFLYEKTYTPEIVWASLQSGIVTWDIPENRGEKILEKSKKVDTYLSATKIYNQNKKAEQQTDKVEVTDLDLILKGQYAY